ncbi:MAG: NAD(P)-dependent oxidoreductase [Clostridia bacterium]|nr:NAD(P)-dependent oxidoreductase [Clostridia bacterium]
MPLRITNEANRCLQCKRPLCREGCPARTAIPQVIALFRENRLLEAGKMLFDNNPMSLVCSIVCDHMAQCTGHCVLNRKGHPVHFYEIERFVSDAYLDRMTIERVPFNGKTAAVIGSGPAGMTAAIMLARGGYGVTIFEEKDRIGGMMQYGIPEFRLPKTILDRYKARLLEMGVCIRPHVVMGGDLMIDNLFRDGYRTVFIATGVWRPSTLGIEGETLANVHFGISYLARPISYSVGQTVAVVGMGNVAMDVARTAFRHGAQRVMLFERADKSPASPHEIEYAQLDGAEFYFRKSVSRITPEGPVFCSSVLDAQGRVVGTESDEELVKADTTIIAINQRPKDKLVNTTHGLEASEKGLLIVDENNMTTRPGVFAAGDVVHGSLTVVHAVNDAKNAAAAMMRYMENNG